MGFRDGAKLLLSRRPPRTRQRRGVRRPERLPEHLPVPSMALVRKRGLVRAPGSKPAGREAEAPFPHLVSLLRVRGETRVRPSVQSRSF